MMDWAPCHGCGAAERECDASCPICGDERVFCNEVCAHRNLATHVADERCGASEDHIVRWVWRNYPIAHCLRVGRAEWGPAGYAALKLGHDETLRYEMNEKKKKNAILCIELDVAEQLVIWSSSSASPPAPSSC